MIHKILPKFKNTYLLKEAGIRKQETGTYCPYPKGSSAAIDWWKEEARRCKEGFEAGGTKITGFHYFHLNYHPLNLKVKSKNNQVTRKIRGTANFWAIHYDFFWALEEARKKGLDLIVLKPRRCGWTELASSIGACNYTFYPRSKTYYLASSEKYLVSSTGILPKVWDNLDYLNEETDGAFGLLAQKKNTKFERRASWIDDFINAERGTKQEIIGIVVDSPDKVRGGDADFVLMEEAGVFPQFKNTITATKHLVEENGIRTGTIIAWGTGGTEDVKDIEGFREIFYNPEAWGFMAFEDYFGDSGKKIGYFIPSYYTYEKLMDNDGNVDYEKAKEELEKEREKQRTGKSAFDYNKYCAEIPFTPQEAFILVGTNKFNQLKIADQLVNVDLYKNCPVPKVGNLYWVRDENGNVSSVYFQEDPNGKIKIIEHPEKTETGEDYKNLYIAGLDSIDQGIELSTSDRGSKLALLVKKRIKSLQETNNYYVCMYIDRPAYEEEAYENVLKILWYYNCNVNIEFTKKEIISYFRKYNQSHRFVKRPAFARNDPNGKSKTNLIGTQATKEVIAYMDNRIRDYIENYCDRIYFKELLEQLRDYNSDVRTKYDLVVAMGLAEVADEDMRDLLPIGNESEINIELVGYYKDHLGIKRFGKIPTNNDDFSKIRWVDRRHKNISPLYFDL